MKHLINMDMIVILIKINMGIFILCLLTNNSKRTTEQLNIIVNHYQIKLKKCNLKDKARLKLLEKL